MKRASMIPALTALLATARRELHPPAADVAHRRLAREARSADFPKDTCKFACGSSVDGGSTMAWTAHVPH